MEGDPTKLEEGSSFPSFEDFMETFKTKKDSLNAVYKIGHSETIKGYTKKHPDVLIRDAIK